MSFVLPTTVAIVDRPQVHWPRNARPLRGVEDSSGLDDKYTLSQPTLWQIVSKYDTFRELVKIAHMENILNDPQTRLTVFIPLDLTVPKLPTWSCDQHDGTSAHAAEVMAVSFESARTIVNSLIIPSVLTTTMMMQSAFRRFKTRNLINTLTFETPHCVQFEPRTFNKPPFGIVLNGKSRILTPDLLASNGIVHTVDIFPYVDQYLSKE